MIVVFRTSLLPPSFSYDGIHIQDIANDRVYVENNYIIVANFYRAFGLANQPLLAGLLGYSLAVITTLFIHFRSPRVANSLAGLILFSASIILSAVYLGFYSKDIFVLAIPLCLLIASKRSIGEALILTFIGLYAFYFRTYWWIVLILYVLLRLTFREKIIKPKFWILALTAGSAIAGLAIFLQTGDSSAYRVLVNEFRIGSDDASTMITSLIPIAGPIGGVLNTVFIAFSLIIPIPMLLLGGIYPLIAIALGTIWFIFFKTLKTLSAPYSVTLIRATTLLCAFVAVQSSFEPDYGSAIRHLTPLLGLMILIPQEAQPSSQSKAEE